MTEFKSFTAEFKATGGTKAGDAGYVEAYVSMFGNVDYGGDRMVPGAFSKTLAEWKDSGDPIPAIWSHDWDNPDAHIGVVEDVIEDEKGLKVRMKIDLDRPFANQVFHLLKNRRVREFSFGYITREADVVQDDEYGDVREIRDVKLIEVGPTLVGMNPATQLLEAASLARRKAGRVLSGKNEDALKQARDLIDEVLTSAQPVDERAASVTDGKSIEKKAAAEDVSEGVFVSWDSSGGRARGRIEHVMTEGILGVPESDFQLEATPEDPALLIRIFRPVRDGWEETETLVGHRTSTVTVIDPLPAPSEESSKSVKAISVPDYVSSNAARGLRYYEDGLGGDGLVESTIRDAREMASGSVSEAKIRKMGPWIARHLVDFDAPQNSDPDHEDYPGPGLVAHLLWGSGPDRAGAERTQAWAEREVAALEGSSTTPDSKSARDTHATIPLTEQAAALLLKTRYREV